MKKDENLKMKYGGYSRKSTESEDRQVLSIGSQLDKNKEIADKLSGERDTKIKQALTTEQYKKYIELEKTLRPNHPGKPGEDSPPKPPKEE